MKKITFSGLDCIELSNETLALALTTQVGPRVVSLRLRGGDNVFAELPDAKLPWDGGGEYSLRGGHRLWHSPEINLRTYIPDDDPLTINEIVNGVEVIQPTETLTGLEKSMRITLPDDSATVVVEHTLKNNGVFPVECAPWGITQLATGGTAILPQTMLNADPGGYLPNRGFAFWPYADLQSPLFTIGNRYCFFDSHITDDSKFKLGFPNPVGWLGYVINQTMFVKQAAYDPTASYPDLGSSSEMFCDANCLELETLGPTTSIAPGNSVSHTETWHLFGNIAFEKSEDAVTALVKRLGLDTNA